MAINVLAATALAALLPGAGTGRGAAKNYVVVLGGTQGTGGFQLAGTPTAVQTLVTSAGGTVVNDLAAQIGVLVVRSPNESFDELLRGSSLVASAGEDWS